MPLEEGGAEEGEATLLTHLVATLFVDLKSKHVALLVLQDVGAFHSLL